MSEPAAVQNGRSKRSTGPLSCSDRMPHGLRRFLQLPGAWCAPDYARAIRTHDPTVGLIVVGGPSTKGKVEPSCHRRWGCAVNCGRALMLTRQASLAVAQTICKPATSTSTTTALPHSDLAPCSPPQKHTASAQHAIALTSTPRAHVSHVSTSQDMAGFNEIPDKLHIDCGAKEQSVAITLQCEINNVEDRRVAEQASRYSVLRPY
jgi:hypothetical protein